jgi:DNA-binding response OmpR family regulator/c-di-GMP-binding flagellar brake protein YcgR
MAFDIATVDAETATRRHLTLALAPFGYQVASFPDARSALPEIIAAPPRLVIADLLLPGMDGFELFQEVRKALGDRVALLGITGVEWGHVDLAEVLDKRFGARMLRKPFLKSEVIDLVRKLIGRGPRRPTVSAEWRIGVEEARRIEELAQEFSTQIARVGLTQGRCSVRTESEFSARVKGLGDWMAGTARNMSSGGLFLELVDVSPSDWPRLDDTVEVSVEIGQQEDLRGRARVAFHTSPEDAAARGRRPGLGLEFTELSPEDRQRLEFVVQEAREARATDPASAPSEIPPMLWVLLVGVEAQELLRRPGFLHRQGIELMSTPTIRAALDFVQGREPAVCVVHESALGDNPAEAIAPLAKAMAGRRVMVVGKTELSSLIADKLCDVVLPASTPMDVVLEEVRAWLGVNQRRAPRVQAQGEVRVHGQQSECQAEMVNLSTGGMLLRAGTEGAIGTDLRIDFDLPGTPGLSCQAVVVRSQPDRQPKQHLWGLSFRGLEGETASLLARFVESHVHFRDFFTWLKNAHFAGRLGKSG